MYVRMYAACNSVLVQGKYTCKSVQVQLIPVYSPILLY